MSPGLNDILFHQIQYFRVCSFFDGNPLKENKKEKVINSLAKSGGILV